MRRDISRLQTNALRVDLYQGSDGCPVIEPGSGAQRHGDAAVRTPLPAELRIIVPAIGSRSIYAVPPGIMQEEPSRSPLQRVVDECRRVPVGGSIRPRRVEGRGMELQENVVTTPGGFHPPSPRPNSFVLNHHPA